MTEKNQSICKYYYKIILYGKVGVGKTSFFNCFMTGKYELDFMPKLGC